MQSYRLVIRHNLIVTLNTEDRILKLPSDIWSCNEFSNTRVTLYHFMSSVNLYFMGQWHHTICTCCVRVCIYCVVCCMGEENAVTVIKAGEMLHCNDSMNRTYNFYSNFLLNTCISALVNRFREKGPNAYMIKFPVRNVTLALKCTAN